MSHKLNDVKKPDLCLCGNPGVKIKSALWVCERCDKIEREMYGRRRLTSGGAKSFPNPGQYSLSESPDYS